MFEEIKEYKYKMETHCHSNPVSGCSEFSPEEVVRKYKKQQFDSIVLTNHFINVEKYRQNKTEFVKWWLEDYYRAKAEGEKVGLLVHLGMEIRFANINNNDYLVYGIDEEDVKKAADYLDSDLETFYKEFKNDKNVILQAHPCRNGIEVADPAFVDGYEVFNMHPEHNQRVPVAREPLNLRDGLLVCGGTDFHHEGHEGAMATCTKTLPRSSFEVADILKKQDLVFDLRGSIIIP